MKNYLIIYLTVSILFILTSCKGTEKVTLKKDLYEIIYKNNVTGSNAKSVYLIRNFEDYKALLLKLGFKNIPYVDFDNSNILVLNMGEKKSYDYEIYPEKIIENDDKLIISFKEINKKHHSSKETKFLYPITILKINSKKELVLM